MESKGIAFSNGEFTTTTSLQNSQSEGLRKKKGSSSGTHCQLRKATRKRVANRRRLLCQAVRISQGAPEGIAERTSVRSLSRSARGTRQAPGTGVGMTEF